MNKKEKVELRFYEVPQKPPLIALLGKRWILHYGDDGMHFHNYMEIGYCYYGKGKLYLGNHEKPYKASTITLIPQNSIHRTESQEGGICRWEFLFIDIYRFLSECYPDSPQYAKKLADRISASSSVRNGKDHPRLETLVRFILDEMRDKKENYKDNVRGYLFSLLQEIARIMPPEEDHLLPVSEQNIRHCLANAINYIEAHYKEDLRVRDLARINFMSESHFRRVFIESLRINPAEYLNVVRIQKACQLLSTTDESLEWIGSQVGFLVEPTFIRNFKKVMGTSPKQWRAAAKENGELISNYQIAVCKGW